MTKTIRNYINDQWQESVGGHLESVPNPATGEEIAKVPISTAEDVT